LISAIAGAYWSSDESIRTFLGASAAQTDGKKEETRMEDRTRSNPRRTQLSRGAANSATASNVRDERGTDRLISWVDRHLVPSVRSLRSKGTRVKLRSWFFDFSKRHHTNTGGCQLRGGATELRFGLCALFLNLRANAYKLWMQRPVHSSKAKVQEQCESTLANECLTIRRNTGDWCPFNEGE